MSSDKRRKVFNTATGEWDDPAPKCADAEHVPEVTSDVSPFDVAVSAAASLRSGNADGTWTNDEVKRLLADLAKTFEAERKVVAQHKQFLIARQPLMGVSATRHDPLHRSPWWSEIRSSDIRFDALVANFQQSLIGHKNRCKRICDVPQLEVTQIHQRFNPREAANYDRVLRSSPSGECLPIAHDKLPDFVKYPWQRIDNLGDIYNEIFAWHGSRRDNEVALEQNGFCMQFVRPSKGIYGDGLYFSPHASKSDMYQSSYLRDKTVYLVRLNMGRVRHITCTCKGTRGPFPESDTTRAIGHVANGTLNDEYIIFDGARAQIAYKFTYHHMDSCGCAMCKPDRIP